MGVKETDRAPAFKATLANLDAIRADAAVLNP
jgi:hypothetical protein